MKTIKIMIATVALTVSASALLCDKSCTECSFILPQIKSVSAELYKEYLEAEREIADEYSKKIVRLLNENKKIQTEITKQRLKIETIEKLKLVEDKKINKLLEDIKTTKYTKQEKL